nr:hypothetical protein [bacterium]
MKEKRKLVLIGAGSVAFLETLIGDLIINPGEFSWEIALCDIAPEALEGARGLTERMVALAGADMKVTASTDRRQLLPGADYVVTTIAVGGRKARLLDCQIPRKYGIYQPVADTAMPGGVSRAMRMVPAMVEIANDVGDLCPDAHFFNYSNPMAILCRAVRKATGVPLTGLCHGVPETEEALAKYLGVEVERLHTRGAGLNHCTFLHDIRVDGKDVKLEIEARLRAIAGTPAWDDIENHPYQSPVCSQLFLETGCFAAPGDRHVVEFFPERTPHGAWNGGTLGVDRFPLEEKLEGQDKRYQRTLRRARGEEEMDVNYFAGRDGETEKLVSMIHALEHDGRGVYWANVPNQGSVPNLPDHFLLELPCVATASGFVPIQQLDFPDAAAGLTAKNHSYVDISVDAALRQNRDAMIYAIWMGGYLPDIDACARLTDELLATHGIAL